MANRVKIRCDYYVKSSPAILFNFLTQPEGLIQWFADHVDTEDEDYMFTWNGAVERGVILEKEENSFIRLKMPETHEEDEYLEFRIEKAEISNDTILIVNDFADEDEVDDQRALWDSQIQALRGCVGGSN